MGAAISDTPRKFIMARHKHKTLATFLASVFGGFGLHRFYLRGLRDFWGWAHLLTVPMSLPALWMEGATESALAAAPFVLSVLIGFLEALIIGLTADEKWDALHNAQSNRQSNSGWPVVLLVVLTMSIGSTAMIAAMSRMFDLLLTGGSYG